MRGYLSLSLLSLCVLAGCIHSMPFAPEAERNWAQAKPTGQPRAAKVAGPGQTLVFSETTASSPLEIKAVGPVKIHLQVRIRVRPGVKGRIKLRAWTQVDDHAVVPRGLNVKISKKWREKNGGATTTRRIIKLHLGSGAHVVRFGLAPDSVETALVRVVTRTPAEEK